MGTLHKDKHKFVIISSSVLLRMRDVSDKSCRENLNTHSIFNNIFLKHAIYEIMWKNVVQPDSP